MDADEEDYEEDGSHIAMSVVYMEGGARRHNRWTLAAIASALLANISADVSEFWGQLSRAAVQHAKASELQEMADEVGRGLDALPVTEGE